MKLNSPEDVLRGITLQVYRYVLKNHKPTGIREVQNSLNLSSPRLAFYHLNKLEEVGLVKKTSEGYVADRIVLHDSVRLKRFLVPRQFFYALFFATMLGFQLTLFKPDFIKILCLRPNRDERRTRVKRLRDRENLQKESGLD